jgi:hypothetical protein
VRGYREPAIVAAQGPEAWRPGEDLVVQARVANGEYASALRLHYREADQLREFHVAEHPAGRSGEHVLHAPTRFLDAGYDIIWYLELLDVLGGGTFYPDPFTDARYRVCRRAAAQGG